MHKSTLKTLIVAAASLFALNAVAQNMHTDSLSSEMAASSPAVGSSAASGVHRSPTRYLGDKTISTKINTKFLADEGLKLRHLKVRTYKGVVHLSGYAASKDEADHAVSIAKDTDGVKSVRSTIKVQAPNS